MSKHVTEDGTRLVFDDLGEGEPVVLLHGWSLDRTCWEHQVPALLSAGRRCVAYDRRGHGLSDVPAQGYDAGTLADDLAGLMTGLDVRGATLVSHSMGSGEIVRYLARHGADRVARVVLLAPTTPMLLATDTHPVGLTVEMVEGALAEFARDRADWFDQRREEYFALGSGEDRVSRAYAEHTMRICLGTAPHVQLACQRAMLTTDFRADVAACPVPTLVLHGDADASASLDLTGRPTAELLPQGDLRVYPGAPHGLYATHADEINAHLLAFGAHA
jgi:non-heme chloroperoxidase